MVKNYGMAVCGICKTKFWKWAANQKYCNDECAEKAMKLWHLEHQKHGRFIIFERDGFRCVYCGRSSFGDYAELHVDHIQPRKEGGQDIAGNLVTACARCNREKASNPLCYPEEILEEVTKRNTLFDIDPNTQIKI